MCMLLLLLSDNKIIRLNGPFAFRDLLIFDPFPISVSGSIRDRGLSAINVKNHAKSFQIADISRYTHFL